MSKQHCALVMAGGTGGHIFPGLAVAQALRDKGWRVHWLGAPASMESRLVPARGFTLETIAFGGVRGKGRMTLLLLPMRLLRAFWQALQVVRRVKPDVLVGLGGYITFPGGMMGVLAGKPLVLHEQNSVAGMANKVLAQVADRVFTAFPGVFAKGECVGNPLRSEFLNQADPQARFAGRSGALRLLVVGGSLGARALNTVVPQALALIPEAQRPVVIHQSGEKQIDELRANYTAAGVQAELTPFIADTAAAFAAREAEERAAAAAAAAGAAECRATAAETRLDACRTSLADATAEVARARADADAAVAAAGARSAPNAADDAAADDGASVPEAAVGDSAAGVGGVSTVSIM